MSHVARPEPERREAAHRVTPVGTLLVITLIVAVYPIVFWTGYQRSWWRDPDGEAWALFVVTAVVGASMALVLIGAAINPSAVTSIGRLLGSVIVLSIGLPLAAIAGLAAGLAGFSCSGGVIGEGCGGGSQVVGLLVGATALALAVWLAWLVGRPRG